MVFFLWSLLTLRAWGSVSDFTQEVPEGVSQHSITYQDVVGLPQMAYRLHPLKYCWSEKAGFGQPECLSAVEADPKGAESWGNKPFLEGRSWRLISVFPTDS